MMDVRQIAALAKGPIVGLALMAPSVAHAAPKDPPSPTMVEDKAATERAAEAAQRAAAAPAIASPGNTVLIGTLYTCGRGSDLAPGEKVWVPEPQPLECPSDGGTCRLEVETHAIVAGGSGNMNYWKVCAQLDGTVDMSRPQCPFLGTINPDIAQSNGFYQNAVGVPAGKHVASVSITSTGGIGSYSVCAIYRLYH